MTERTGHAPADHETGSPADQVMAVRLPATRPLADSVELVRIRACLAGGASALLGAFLSGGLAHLTDGRCIIASGAIALAVAAANVVNDIVDVRADAASGRSRPLPSGRIAVRTAQVAAAALAAGALLLGFADGLAPGLEMAGLLALAIAYSYAFKSTVLVGNLLVAACASFPVIYGGAVTGPLTPAICAACALSFLFILSYETLKTLRDRESDAAAGLRTLATSAAPGSSVRLFALSVMVLGGATVAASVVSSTPVLYLVSVLPLLGMLTIATVLCAQDQPSASAIERSLHLLRIAWFIGLIDMLMLR